MLDRRNPAAWMAASVLVGSFLLLSGVILTMLAPAPPAPRFGPPWPPTLTPPPLPPTPTPIPFTPISGAIPHPTGKQDIIVRLDGGVGFIPSLYSYLYEFPDFTLYGDGTAIYGGENGYHQMHLDEAAIQRLLDALLNKQRFFGLDSALPMPNGRMVTDAGTTTVRVGAAGQDYTVGASALAHGGTPARRRLTEIARTIRDLMVDDAPFYQPAAAILYRDLDQPLIPELTPPPPDPAIPVWPVPGVRIADARDGEFDIRHMRLTGAAAAAALQAAARPTRFTQEGHVYTVLVVPELP
jgi:hypothetical protein